MTQERSIISYKKERRFVFERDNQTCQYCETVLPSEVATADHVIPRGRGGSHDRHNLKCACPDCNNEKGALTLLEWREELQSTIATSGSPVTRLSKILQNVESILTKSPELMGENVPPTSAFATLDRASRERMLTEIWSRWQRPVQAAQQQNAHG